MPPLTNLIGQKFGKLTVIKRAEDNITPKGHHEVQYVCHCDCGKEITIKRYNLVRGHIKSCGCLDNFKVWCEENNRLDLLDDWDYEKNAELKPEDVSYGSRKKVWWKCKKGHKYQSAISNRSGLNRGCPFCSNTFVMKGCNDLATTNPSLAEQWNYSKNKGLTNKKGEDISTPDKIGAGSLQKVWWLLPYDVPDDYPVISLRGKHFDFEWQAVVKSRTDGRDCPFLSTPPAMVYSGFNDLKTVNPDLASEWHPIKNKGLTPEIISSRSNKIVWWLGKCGHEWKNSVSNRAAGRGCPICKKERRTSFPEQAILFYLQQYFSDVKNGDIESIGEELDIFIPSIRVAIEYDGVAWHNDKQDKELLKNNLCKKHNIKLIRIREKGLCLYDSCICIVRDDYKSEDDLTNVIRNIFQILNIPNNHIDVKADRSKILETYLYEPKFKDADMLIELEKDWHPTLNGRLQLNLFKRTSNKKVWWKCHTCGYEWQTSISNRVNQHSGCPECARKTSFRKVYCVELDKIFDGVTIAAAAIGLRSCTSIVDACRGRTKTAGGYHWKYVD